MFDTPNTHRHTETDIPRYRDTAEWNKVQRVPMGNVQ